MSYINTYETFDGLITVKIRLITFFFHLYLYDAIPLWKFSVIC